MQYIGIPTCPYCKKRVNIIRVWSMKKHGEFMCPRCKGISNIFLSPIVYISAILAVAASFLIYFFSKFVTDSVSLMTVLQVFIPFGIFFILCLFFVYLEKPVIRRVKRTPDGRYFDEQGNEMKMKMGKLVSASPNQTTGTGRIPQPQRQEYVSNDFDKPVNNYSERPAQSSPQKPDVVESFDEPVEFNNNFNRYDIQDMSFETSKIKDVQQIPVGNIARERAESNNPNSGFEDLFDNYSPTKQATERQPRADVKRDVYPRQSAPRRTENSQKKKPSGGSRFRDL